MHKIGQDQLDAFPGKKVEECPLVAAQKAAAAGGGASTAAKNLKLFNPGSKSPGARAADDIRSGVHESTFKPQPAAQNAVRRFKDPNDTFGKTAKTLAPKLSKMETEELYRFMKQEVDQGKVPPPRNVPLGGDPSNPQYIFEYQDGTVVRIKPNGDKLRPGPTYSIEVKWSDQMADQGPKSIAFKVDPGGNAAPKGPADMQVPSELSPTEQAQYLDATMDAGHRTPIDKPSRR